MIHGVFEVCGKREYRGHPPGTFFEARIGPAEQAAIDRAIARGDIKLLHFVEPALEPGTYRLPPDWPPSATNGTSTEAPQGASLVEEGGKK